MSSSKNSFAGWRNLFIMLPLFFEDMAEITGNQDWIDRCPSRFTYGVNPLLLVHYTRLYHGTCLLIMKWFFLSVLKKKRLWILHVSINMNISRITYLGVETFVLLHVWFMILHIKPCCSSNSKNSHYQKKGPPEKTSLLDNPKETWSEQCAHTAIRRSRQRVVTSINRFFAKLSLSWATSHPATLNIFKACSRLTLSG